MTNIWGDNIDALTLDQIEAASKLPIARGSALMADAHLGYGLPIGGVLATEASVLPYGVGVDIACRMRLSITNVGPQRCESLLHDPRDVSLANALRTGTKFGLGCHWEDPHDHDVMDSPVWETTPHLQELKDTAWRQLGTSGGGNHFVEWGLVYVTAELAKALGGEMIMGRYIGLLSHSGSRGPGNKTCQKYTKIAKQLNPAGELSWLDLDTQEGDEYWSAMNLMGEFAAANHEKIHETVLRNAGVESIGVIENHHNFAWLEDGLVVHRKGATPAQEGVLGIIPGSMSSPGYIVRGKGNALSLNSASHGAGRRMSRKQAKNQLNWKDARAELQRKRIWLLDAGLDEVRGAYKDIDKVMDSQADLVETIGRFDPKIVLMCGEI